jgi:DNA-binding IclR family transcriptional regulator
VSSHFIAPARAPRPKPAAARKPQPLDRMLAVIEAVLAAPGRLSVATLAADLDLPLPSAARLVTQLEARRLLRRGLGTRQLSPGPRLIDLGLNAARATFMGDAAHVLLVGLAARLGEHCQIGVVSGTEVAYVDSARGARGASLQFEPGERAPIHCTSTGKLFLAELDDAALPLFLGQRPLRRHTPSTVTDPAVLIAQVREARGRGWATTDGEYAAGVVGCAVPIRGRDNAMLASVAVAIPAARTPFSAIGRFVPALRDTAKAIGLAIEADRAAR